MTSRPEDESQFADLLDELLEQVLDGMDPDADTIAAKYPAAQHRVKEALTLASNLAGRKVSKQPTLEGYEIVRELGRGGMGTVYLAKQAELQREVALKVMPHSFGLSHASRQRFLEEARALAHVKHDNIVDIHRVVDDGEMLAFEMEFIDGPSLHSVLADMRVHVEEHKTPPTLALLADKLNIDEAELGDRSLTTFFVRLLLKVARALAAVHAQGFVHRDVKPANILLRQNGDPVLVDFGLVRLTNLEVTHAGQFAGTPVYSSPEQLRGQVAVGPTADVYSLGVTLYECLTLTPPFAGRTTTDVLQRIEQGRFRPLRQLLPTAPRDLETIVAHAMEIDHEQRYANGGALADDLQRLLELHPIQAQPVHPLRRVAKFLRRNRKNLLAATVGAAVVAAAMLPILHNVDAASRAKESATEHLRTARQDLIRVDSGSVDWRHTVWGSTSRPRVQSADKRGRWLRAAADEYTAALQFDPDNDQTQQELQVVQLTMWLQQLTVPHRDALADRLASDEFRDVTANLGPATVRAARLIAGELGEAVTPEEITASANTDRKTLGMLAYLFGDFRLCEDAWSRQSDVLLEHPLIDAGLGRLLLADGMAEPAYTRLSKAQRHFPDSVTLKLELADAALHLGDLTLAEQWLAELPQKEPATPMQRRLRLDIRAATELGADLTRDYEQLLRDDPYDPMARHRLAQLAMRRGDLTTAKRHLDTLLVGWPMASEFRLDRARVALQQRDLVGYASQVLAVLDQDFGRNRSRGTTADLLEVLRIGGLEHLYLKAVEATNHESSGRSLFGGEIAIHSFAPRFVTEHFEDVAEAMKVVAGKVRQLRGRERIVDAASEQLLFTLPLVTHQLQLDQQMPLIPRALLTLAPSYGPQLYDKVRPYLQQALFALKIGRWRRVDLPEVRAPSDLPAKAIFGHAIVTVDDLTGDGIEELLVAAPVYSPSHGIAHVYLMDGKSRKPLSTMRATSPVHLFGHTIAKLDDIDGDRRMEWLIGSPAGTQETRRGQVELWSGGKQERLRVIEGDEPGFGASLAGLGDCDGDGIPDFAVASPALLRNSAAQGKVQVFSGRTFEPIITWHSDKPGIWFAALIANAKDVDGDGCDDLVVGGNYTNAPGLVRVYSVKKKTVLHTWADPSPLSGFGAFVGPAGDVDHDGCADVIVTALGSEEALDRILIYSGKTGDPIVTLTGERPGDGFGKSVVPMRHRNGSTSLIVGVPFGGDPAMGSVELVSLAGMRTQIVRGPAVRGAFGWALSATSDQDGDLLPELLVTAPAAAGTGKVWLLHSGIWLPTENR